MATTESGRSIRPIGLLVAFLFLLPVFLMLVMTPMMPMMRSGAYHMDTTGTSPLWMAGMMAIRLVLVAGLLYVAYRFLTGGTVRSEDPALEELRLAYPVATSLKKSTRSVVRSWDRTNKSVHLPSRRFIPNGPEINDLVNRSMAP